MLRLCFNQLPCQAINDKNVGKLIGKIFETAFVQITRNMNFKHFMINALRLADLK